MQKAERLGLIPIDRFCQLWDNNNMNLLSHVKNNQHFCLAEEPAAIYQRLNDRVRLYQDSPDDGEARIVVRVKALSTGRIFDVKRPATIKVIPLGKK